jgi:P-type Ca2+ transporter type 2C
VPRLAEVPFDSAYKFMATFHEAPRREASERVVGAVKGAPDVVLDRCSHALWHGEVVTWSRSATRSRPRTVALGTGLRVLSFAVRFLGERERDTVAADPMSYVSDLVFVSLVGIIDPLRPSAKTAVATALRAGIDVRMITGDHAITARAIAEELGLGPTVITGSQLQRVDR